MPSERLDPQSRRRALAGAFGAAVAALALGRAVPLATQAAPRSGAGGRDERVVTSRLGISAGEEIVDVPLGTSGPALEEQLPLLFETAATMGVRIETASDRPGLLLRRRPATLRARPRPPGQRAPGGGQRPGGPPRPGLGAVLRLYLPSRAGRGGRAGGAGTPVPALATATLPLPYGAQALTDEIYQALVAELSDGGHVRYAGPGSLLFVANTGDESEGEFRARMERVARLLGQAGISSGPLQLGRAELLVADRDNYDDLIEAPNRSLAPAT